MKLLKICLYMMALLSFSASLFCTNITKEELFKKGLEFHKEKKYEEAFPYFVQAAQAGYAAAQNGLGLYYKQGYGTDKDQQQAFEWFYKAAKQDNKEGKYNLALIYLSGIEGEDGKKIGTDLLTEVANQGHIEGSYKLAKCYEEGIGIAQSSYDAKAYYIKAANKNYVKAFNKLGHFFLKEIARLKMESKNPSQSAIAQSHSLATMWFEKSANKEDPEGLYNFATLQPDHSYGRKPFELYEKAANKDYAPAQYELGCRCSKDNYQTSAFEWFKKAADLGHTQAQFRAAECYHNGKGIKLNLEQAEKYYLLAAENNDSSSQISLAELYEKGHGISIKKDKNKSLFWYEKAAAQGLLKAQLYLAEYYVGENKQEQGLYWYEKAATQDSEKARYYLGRYFFEQNAHQRAFEWFSKMENSFLLDSFLQESERRFFYYVLATYYMKGEVTKKNEEKAVEYYELAAKNGSKKAQEVLSNINKDKFAQLNIENHVQAAEFAQLFKEQQNFELACFYYKKAYEILLAENEGKN
jgi:TPR repeat protein